MKIELSKFVALLIDHQEIIRSFIITQIPGSPDVRDVLQEVNIVLWEKRGSFKEGTNFGAWACTVARYKVLEHRRKEARRNGVLLFNDELCELLGETQGTGTPAFSKSEDKHWNIVFPSSRTITNVSSVPATHRSEAASTNMPRRPGAPTSPCG